MDADGQVLAKLRTIGWALVSFGVIFAMSILAAYVSGAIDEGAIKLNESLAGAALGWLGCGLALLAGVGLLLMRRWGWVLALAVLASLVPLALYGILDLLTGSTSGDSNELAIVAGLIFAMGCAVVALRLLLTPPIRRRFSRARGLGGRRGPLARRQRH